MTISAFKPYRLNRGLTKAALILLFAMAGVPVFCHAESSDGFSLIVEDIRCKGNALTRCTFIRGFLHLSPGDPLSEEEIQNAKLRLSSLSDFVSVQIYLDKGSAKGRAIVVVEVVEVVEADRIDNQVSAGVSSRLSRPYARRDQHTPAIRRSDAL
jgi:hypothetical protein